MYVWVLVDKKVKIFLKKVSDGILSGKAVKIVQDVGFVFKLNDVYLVRENDVLLWEVIYINKNG